MCVFVAGGGPRGASLRKETVGPLVEGYDPSGFESLRVGERPPSRRIEPTVVSHGGSRGQRSRSPTGPGSGPGGPVSAGETRDA